MASTSLLFRDQPVNRECPGHESSGVRLFVSYKPWRLMGCPVSLTLGHAQGPRAGPRLPRQDGSQVFGGRIEHSLAVSTHLTWPKQSEAHPRLGLGWFLALGPVPQSTEGEGEAKR